MTERIAPLCPPYPEGVAEDLSKLMPPNMAPLALFRTVAHNPRVLRRMRRGGLLDPGSITAAERELVILRTTARCGSEYEWGVHAAYFAQRVGLGSTVVAATVHGSPDDAVWTTEQATLVGMCDESHERATLSAATFARLQRHWSKAQIIELVMLAGLYRAISLMTNALALAPEPGAPRFPAAPDGT